MAEMLCSRAQSATGLYLISKLTEILKWAAAGYLLFRSVKEIKQKYSNVLLVELLFMQRLWQQTGYGDYMSRSLAGGLRKLVQQCL